MGVLLGVWDLCLFPYILPHHYLSISDIEEHSLYLLTFQQLSDVLKLATEKDGKKTKSIFTH